MFDTMTATKAVGGVCGAFLIFLLSNWAAEALYYTGGGGHGEEGAAQAYVIDTGDTGGEGGGGDEAGPDFATVFASADPAKGEKVFNKCKACHKIDGSNGTGPHLDGVVGRAVGAVDGFAYSDAMANHGGNWEPEKLDAFLHDPKGDVPGTKMTFAGLPKIDDRANLIAYLQSLGG